MNESGETSGTQKNSSASADADMTSGRREPDGVYQKQKLVARVNGAEVDANAREIRIDEVYQSDDLVIPDECEYRDFRMQIQTIQFASKIDRGEPEKGRVLRGVVADILGNREP